MAGRSRAPDIGAQIRVSTFTIKAADIDERALGEFAGADSGDHYRIIVVVENVGSASVRLSEGLVSWTNEPSNSARESSVCARCGDNASSSWLCSGFG